MNKNLIFSLFLSVSVAVLTAGNFALAEEESSVEQSPASTTPASPEVTTRHRTRTPAPSPVKRLEHKARNEVKETGETVKREVKDHRETLKAKQEQFHEALQTKKEELKQVHEAKKMELKDKLQAFKDQHKKEVAEKIDKSMAQLKDRMIQHFSDAIKKIENVLGRVSEKTDAAETRGLDVASIRTAIAKAETAIANARLAVEELTGKNYTLNVMTEESVKQDVGAARQTLHKDLIAVKQAVKSAQEAVRQTAVALAQILKASRPSPTVSPTEVPVQ